MLQMAVITGNQVGDIKNIQLTFTLSSGCLTTLSLRNLVGMNPWTPLSNLVRTPIA